MDKSDKLNHKNDYLALGVVVVSENLLYIQYTVGSSEVGRV
jgi:hypothetical protein